MEEKCTVKNLHNYPDLESLYHLSHLQAGGPIQAEGPIWNRGILNLGTLLNFKNLWEGCFQL